MIACMAPQTADQFLERVLGDEGWQGGLDGASIEAVIARLETILPPEATVADDRDAHLRGSLRDLGELVRALRAGTLDEPTLVAAWLRLMEA